MFKKTVLKIIYITFFLFIGIPLYAQIKFSNPGFEDVAHANTPPIGWDSCSGSPDCDSPTLIFYLLPAYEGNTYLGIQSELRFPPPNYESAGQKLNCTLIPKKTHHFTLYGYNVGRYQPILELGGILQLWAGFSKCELDTMLWESPVLDTTWQQYSINFTPNKPYSYITFVSNNIDSSHSYIGIDNLSDIAIEGYNFLSTSFTDTIIQKDSCFSLNANSDDSTANYIWHSIPTGFVGAGSSIIDCPTHSTKYVCTATYGCGSQKTDTVNVNVVPNEVESIMLKGGAFIFPNPVTDEINIEILNDIPVNEVKVVDVMGKVWKRFKPIQSTSQINMIDLPQGIYFIQIKTIKGVLVYKIMKE